MSRTRYDYEDHLEAQREELREFLVVNDDCWPSTVAERLIEAGWRKRG